VPPRKKPGHLAL
jgi:hypothetical protein